MKKLQDKHYIILLIVCVIIMVGIVALTKGKALALSTLIAGIGGVAGLTIGTVIRKKTNVGKAVDELNPKAHRQLTVFLILGALLTMAGIVLLVLHLK